MTELGSAFPAAGDRFRAATSAKDPVRVADKATGSLAIVVLASGDSVTIQCSLRMSPGCRTGSMSVAAQHE